MNVLFVAGFGPIAPEMEAAQTFYAGTLGLPLAGDATYLSTEELNGSRHFAVWPLSMAAQSCFGTDAWPHDVPAPQGWVEFDVDDVGAATAELEAKGYRLLVTNKTEPWGQTVSRLLGPEGLLVGITYTPNLRTQDEG
jgi:catechol 2,3-dioxygenase-like lactoylglutathione lyase family enzyme